MKIIDGVTAENGDDITSEYLASDLVETYFLYDLHYDHDQPPHLLTNRPGGADVVMVYEDETEEELHYIEAAIEHGSVGQKSTGEFSTNELTVYDQFRQVEALFRRQSMNGCRVVIRKLVGNQATISPNRGVQHNYAVDGYSLQGNVASIKLSLGINLLDSIVGRRVYRTCPWIFGGSRCKYAKADGEVCDKTFEACARRENLANFGGFPATMHGNARRV